MGVVPLRQFVIKVTSRCDLRCDHCYVYEMADRRWNGRPAKMSPATVDRLAFRIAEHARAHGLPRVDLALHGGEPLLAGARLLRRCVTAVQDAVPAGVEVRPCLQTHGLLLDEDWLEELLELDVRVGISLDGDCAAQDRHRKDAHGNGIHSGVMEAVTRLRSGPYQRLFSGFLCTVDLRNDPLATYEALREHDPPCIDFLLPHGTRTDPPPGLPAGTGRTPYGDWLVTVFDHWYGQPQQHTRVRLFDSVLAELLGGTSSVESVGSGPAASIVVETDGGIEQSDLLACAFEGAAATGKHVDRDSFDDVLALPQLRAERAGPAGLCKTCRECNLVQVCGGGIRAHRYGPDGFDHPSVYCADLRRLIEHVRQRVAADLTAAFGPAAAGYLAVALSPSSPTPRPAPATSSPPVAGGGTDLPGPCGATARPRR
jgi:uncharacterized protein